MNELQKNSEIDDEKALQHLLSKVKDHFYLEVMTEDSDDEGAIKVWHGPYPKGARIVSWDQLPTTAKIEFLQGETYVIEGLEDEDFEDLEDV